MNFKSSYPSLSHTAAANCSILCPNWVIAFAFMRPLRKLKQDSMISSVTCQYRSS